MYTVATIRHPRRRSYHASLACALGITRANEVTLHVSTEAMVRGEGRRPCPQCWSPEGYVVIPDHIGARLEHKAAPGYGV